MTPERIREIEDRYQPLEAKGDLVINNEFLKELLLAINEAEANLDILRGGMIEAHIAGYREGIEAAIKITDEQGAYDREAARKQNDWRAQRAFQVCASTCGIIEGKLYNLLDIAPPVAQETE